MRGMEHYDFATLITAFLYRMSLSNSHNDILATSIYRWCLPGDNDRRESSVAGAIQGMCVVERAFASRHLRHFPACDTLPAGECEAAREFRAQQLAQRLSATRFLLSPRESLKLNPVMHWEYHCNPGRVTVAGGVGSAVSIRRDGAAGRGRRASGARAPAPLLVAPHWKVKVSGAGRGGSFLPLSLAPWFIPRLASRSLPATPATRSSRSDHVPRPPRAGGAAPRRDVALQPPTPNTFSLRFESTCTYRERYLLEAWVKCCDVNCILAHYNIVFWAITCAMW